MRRVHKWTLFIPIISGSDLPWRFLPKRRMVSRDRRCTYRFILSWIRLECLVFFSCLFPQRLLFRFGHWRHLDHRRALRKFGWKSCIMIIRSGWVVCFLNLDIFNRFNTFLIICRLYSFLLFLLRHQFNIWLLLVKFLNRCRGVLPTNWLLKVFTKYASLQLFDIIFFILVWIFVLKHKFWTGCFQTLFIALWSLEEAFFQTH